jgi:hypothetical protein
MVCCVASTALTVRLTECDCATYPYTNHLGRYHAFRALHELTRNSTPKRARHRSLLICQNTCRTGRAVGQTQRTINMYDNFYRNWRNHIPGCCQRGRFVPAHGMTVAPTANCGAFRPVVRRRLQWEIFSETLMIQRWDDQGLRHL